ncbi:hypothetical protein KL921_004775 [Ogataea angusta]|uniref:Uncharacterized protein n=1 Tax=Pichia angusta TaxID=870730 RepID=A0AAN6DB18_PICAN|nr:uncharacterized protein KL928_005285 [Ogataea angusta]KAG7806378.1 hypothetical protein KL921_004775 [Ogataea angusta]KAG7815946.1 hypothetical protein KL928_005285 [Ogataea angusta]KAG7820686.1 hypothetical protein KL909_004558 [Ogataea angusta]KAG7827075.1 hypothetical protein KL920_005073 [Ogataea angusta]KAG7832612.1 hypothetical protein KL943_004949 [Ogataea angusta]
MERSTTITTSWWSSGVRDDILESQIQSCRSPCAPTATAAATSAPTARSSSATRAAKLTTTTKHSVRTPWCAPTAVSAAISATSASRDGNSTSAPTATRKPTPPTATPNINGSAFTGENLPRQLRRQYHSSQSRKRRPLFEEYRENGHRDKRQKKYDQGDKNNKIEKKDKNGKFGGKYKDNRTPQPKKSGVLPQKPAGLPAPSRSGYVSKRKRKEKKDKRR